VPILFATNELSLSLLSVPKSAAASSPDLCPKPHVQIDSEGLGVLPSLDAVYRVHKLGYMAIGGL